MSENRKSIGKRVWVVPLMIVLAAAAGVFFVRTSAYGFYAALKICMTCTVLFIVSLFLIYGVRSGVRWLLERKKRVLRVLILEAALLFYMYFFVYRIKRVITMYQSAQMTFGIIVILLIAVTFFLSERREIPIQRIYLFLGVALGIMYLFMQPVGSIPDEKAHLFASYDVSNTMLGISRTPEGHILMRSDDAAFRLREYSNSHNFELYWDAIDEPAMHEEVLDIGRTPMSTQKYQYIAPALGLTLGRILHCGAAGAFFLGRLFNMLWFVLITAYAIRCLPFGKTVLTALALSPMSLQQASSFSYDAFVNSAAFLLVAMTLRLAYGKEETATKKQKGWHLIHILVLFAACALLLPVKGYAYVPLCFMPLLLVVKKWKENRREALVYLFVVLAVIAVFGVLRLLPLLRQSGLTAPVTTVGSDGKKLYTLSYLFGQPDEWVYVLLNTSRNQGAFYLESMIGSPLSVLTRPINTILVYVYVVVLLLASLKKQGEPQFLGRAAKWWMQIVAWGSVALIMLGMLVAYTDVSRRMIDGVQGRYFIPVVFPMLLTIRSNTVQTSKSLDGPILSAILTCSFFVVHYLIT